MIDLPQIFQSIESLTYNLLIWILLVPKTLAKILFNPSWASGYVTEQLKNNPGTRFDEYFSPVILVILASLLPFIYFYITPAPGVTISATGLPSGAAISSDSGNISSVDNVSINSNITFTAKARFILEYSDYDTFLWTQDQETPITCKPDLKDLKEASDTYTANWPTAGWKRIDLMVCNNAGEIYRAVLFSLMWLTPISLRSRKRQRIIILHF